MCRGSIRFNCLRIPGGYFLCIRDAGRGDCLRQQSIYGSCRHAGDLLGHGIEHASAGYRGAAVDPGLRRGAGRHPDLPGSQFLRNVSVFAEGCIDCGPVHVCHRERISQCMDFGVYLRGLLGDSYYHAWAITSPDRKVWKWMSSDPCTNLYVQYPDVAEMVGWDHYVWYVLHDISDPRRWHESQWYDHQGYQRLLSLCGRPVVSGDFASMLDEAAAVSPAAAAAALPAPGSAASAGSAPYGERDVWSELSPCTPSSPYQR